MSSSDKKQEARDRALSGMLRETLNEPRRNRHDFLARILSEVDGETAAEENRIAKQRFRQWRSAGIVAAALLVVAAVILFESSSFTAQAVASIREFEGKVYLLSADTGARRDVKLGSKIFPGDRLVCDTDGSVVSDYFDGSSIRLTEQGSLSFPEPTGLRQNLANVESGRAVVKAVPKTKGRRRMSFSTPHANGEGAGTTFEVFVTNETTRIRALEGNLRVWNHDEEKEWTPVFQGAGATIRAGTPLVSATFDPASLQPGDIIWEQDFDAAFEKGANIEGSLTTERTESGALETTIKSTAAPAQINSVSFNPDTWISLELYSRAALFSLPEDMEVLIKARCEKNGGHINVALLPAKPKFKAEHNLSQNILVSQEWKKLRIPNQLFLPYDESRPLETGLPIRAVAIWGFETGTITVDRIIVRRAPVE